MSGFEKRLQMPHWITSSSLQLGNAALTNALKLLVNWAGVLWLKAAAARKSDSVVGLYFIVIASI